MTQAQAPYLIHHFLERSADTRPEAPFLVQLGAQHTYGEIEGTANRLANLLISSGLKPGDRVALLAANTPLYVAAYYGILKAGGVAVPLNTSATGEFVAHYLRNCEATHLIVGARLERHVAEAVAQAPSVNTVIAEVPKRLGAVRDGVTVVSASEGMAAASDRRPCVARIDQHVAAIVYTSGSTGLPRGATLSHLNLVSNTRSIVEYLNLTRDDRVLAVLPFYYVYGKTLLNTHAAVGGAVVIENRTLYPAVVLDTLEAEACTGFAGVPSTFAILLNRSNLAERALTALRYVTQAGAAMAPELTRRLQEAIGGRQLVIMYGATEASARLSYLDPADLPRKLGSIGKAIPNVELTVLREDGSEADVGETGELVARGSNIMQGYWNDAEATAQAIDSRGYYHTGDLGLRDDEGYFFVVGRKKDMIKVGGHRIAAKTIEEAIAEHPAVHETAVIGLPDEILGESVCAFAVTRDGHTCSETELERFLKDRLAPQAMPKTILFRSALPKNEAGKIMKQALRDEMNAATAPA